MASDASRALVVRMGNPEMACAIGMALMAPSAAQEIGRLREENAELQGQLSAAQARTRFLESAYRHSARYHARRTRERYRDELRKGPAWAAVFAAIAAMSRGHRDRARERRRLEMRRIWL